jgi:putative spermidine/putrescine transport system ATP-binding protein
VLSAAVYLGDAYELDLDTAAGRIRIVVPSDTPPPSIGSTCQVAAQPGGLSFLT